MNIDHSTMDRWVRVFHPARAPRLRLFCFPYAGGASSYFFPFSAALAPDIEVRAVQYPGRQDRRSEPFASSIGELAEAVHNVISGSGDVTFALFGHSMGAVVAYETARLLEATGLPPRHLLVSGRRAPSRRSSRPLVHHMDEAGLISELRLLGATDPRWLADAELRATILPVVRADYRAIENYRPSPGSMLTCPVTAIVGKDDPYTPVDDAAAWQGHTGGPFALKVFPGGHFFLDQHRSEMIDTISIALDGASTGTLASVAGLAGALEER